MIPPKFDSGTFNLLTLSTLDENVVFCLRRPPQVKMEPLLQMVLIMTCHLNHRDDSENSSDSDLVLAWEMGRGVVLGYLGHPPAPHCQQQIPNLLASRPQARSDLKMISTDKHGETVIRGISQAVFV